MPCVSMWRAAFHGLLSPGCMYPRQIKPRVECPSHGGDRLLRPWNGARVLLPRICGHWMYSRAMRSGRASGVMCGGAWASDMNCYAVHVFFTVKTYQYAKIEKRLYPLRERQVARQSGHLPFRLERVVLLAKGRAPDGKRATDAYSSPLAWPFPSPIVGSRREASMAEFSCE